MLRTIKQESQGALAFPSQTGRCERKEEGHKDRNQVMLRMGGKGKLEKTLQRDGKCANVTEGGNMGCPYQDTGSVVMYNL